MSSIKDYKTKLVKSLLDTMGAVFLRKSDPNKEDLDSDEVNSRISNILDNYTEDLITEAPYSPIKFSIWTLKHASKVCDNNGFICWEYENKNVDSQELYKLYKQDIGL